MQFYAAQNATNVAGCYLQNQKIKKKIDLRGPSPPQHYDKKKTSHAGRENPRTPTPPLHEGAVTMWARAGTFHVLWELAVGEGDFSL
jgi:hypothetical protein